MQTLQVGAEYISCLVGNCRKFISTVQEFDFRVVTASEVKLHVECFTE